MNADCGGDRMNTADAAHALEHVERRPPSMQQSPLDALHLASAVLLSDELTAFIVYDQRLTSAARAAGLVVASARSRSRHLVRWRCQSRARVNRHELGVCSSHRVLSSVSPKTTANRC